jgi:hypothetical protein
LLQWWCEIGMLKVEVVARFPVSHRCASASKVEQRPRRSAALSWGQDDTNMAFLGRRSARMMVWHDRTDACSCGRLRMKISSHYAGTRETPSPWWWCENRVPRSLRCKVHGWRSRCRGEECERKSRVEKPWSEELCRSSRSWNLLTAEYAVLTCGVINTQSKRGMPDAGDALVGSFAYHGCICQAC